MVKSKSAILCNHANEVPAICSCPTDCYCKKHSCKNKHTQKQFEALDTLTSMFEAMGFHVVTIPCPKETMIRHPNRINKRKNKKGGGCAICKSHKHKWDKKLKPKERQKRECSVQS